MNKLICFTICYFVSFGLIHGQSDAPQYFKLTDNEFKIGSIYQLPNVDFSFHNEWFKDEKFQCLDSIVDFLVTHPELSVEIGCHTDCRPISMTNDTLSLYRARDITDYFSRKGIPKDRLTHKGYGHKEPFQLTQDLKTMDSLLIKGTVLTPDLILRTKGNREAYEHLHDLNRRSIMKITSIDRNSKSIDSTYNPKDTSFSWIAPFKYITQHVMENPAPYNYKFIKSSVRQRKNGFAPKNQIIKRYKDHDKWVVLFEDNTYNRVVCGTGYWVAISYNKGQNWNYYYTGITENYPYVFKQNSKLPLMKNDSIMEIECVKVFREVFNFILPVSGKSFLIKDSIYVSINLNEIIKDTDNDGITDVVEKRFLMNPDSNDTDGDGIPDGIDGNPRFKSRKSETGMIYQLLLEHNFSNKVNINRYCFDCNLLKPYSSFNYPTGIHVLVSNNPDVQQLYSQNGRIIIVDSTEYQEMIQRNIHNNMTVIFLNKDIVSNDGNVINYYLRYGDTFFYTIQIRKNGVFWRFKTLSFYLV